MVDSGFLRSEVSLLRPDVSKQNSIESQSFRNACVVNYN